MENKCTVSPKRRSKARDRRMEKKPESVRVLLRR